MKVIVHQYRSVAQWRWKLEGRSAEQNEEDEDEECGICRVAYDACCPDCKHPGDDCPLICGKCTHVFHMHCIEKWINTASSNRQCPLDRRPWVPAGSTDSADALRYTLRVSPSIEHAILIPRRFNSTTPKAKPTPALVQQLRKETSCSISKAIQALSSTGNDYQQALKWLSEDLVTTAQKNATKLAGRTASSGLVALSPLSNGNGTTQVGNLGTPLRVGMVELNCETDFVARSEIFEKLARDLAWAVGFYAEDSSAKGLVQKVDVMSILEAPILHEPNSTEAVDDESASGSSTIRTAIENTITRVGEKIILKRATAICSPPVPLESNAAFSVGLYAHNSTTPKGFRGTTGSVGGAALVQLSATNLRSLLLGHTAGEEAWRSDYRALERALARQLVGFETNGIRQAGATVEDGPQPLYSQEFYSYMPLAARNPRYERLPLDTLEKTLDAWGSASGMEGAGRVEVVDFLKWKVGEEAV